MKMLGLSHLDTPFRCYEWMWYTDNEVLLPGL